MKRKSLLLIIPFAAAALAGCKPAVKPCEQAVITFSQQSVSVAVDHVTQLPFSIEGGKCSGTLVFTSDNEDVATVDSNGKVTGHKEGTATITCNGVSISVTVVAEGDVEVEDVLGVLGHPESVVLNGTINPNDVTLKVAYSDGSEGEKKATSVDCDTSKEGPTTATAHYNEVGHATFDIVVLGEGETEHKGTEDDPYSPGDAALVASGLEATEDSKNPIATEQSFYIKGRVTEFAETFSPEYGNYSFWMGNKQFQVWRIKNGVDKDKFNEGDIEIGDVVTIFAKIMNFKGTPENTSDAYVTKVEKDSPAKEVVSVDSVASGIPAQVTVGTTISASSVKLNVTYSDGSKGVVSATKIEVNTSAVADSVTGKAYYGDTMYAEFTLKVVAQGQTQHAGTQADPYTAADAAIVASGLQQTTDSKNPIATESQFYIKDTVSKLAKDFDAKYGSYSFWLGNDEFEVWQIYNGETKAKFNDGDIAPGYVVTIKAKIMNFKGTPENTTDAYVVSIEKDPTPEKTVVGIKSVSFTKTVYVGGTISPNDVTLTVEYDDQSTGTVKAQSVDGYSTAVAGTTTATAHYGTFTKTFEVAVSEAPSDPVVGQTFTKVNTQSDLSEGIYILGSGNYFFHGADEADKSIVVSDPGDSIVGLEGMAGLQIEEVGGGYSIKVLNGANAGKYIGPKSGTDKNIVFGSDPVAHTISVAEGVSTLTSGEKLLKFNDQTGQNRFRYYTSGQKDVVLYKQGTPTPQKTITGVELQGTLAKSSYVAGQTFDPTGLSLKVSYDDQSEETVTSGFTFNVTNPLEVGEYDLKATYQGHTTEGSVHISVVAKELVSIAITHGMNQTTYQEGSDWNATGIVVQGTYNDGDVQTISSTNYVLSYNPENATGTGSVSVNIVATMNDGSGIKSEAYPQTVTVQEDPVTEPVLVDITIEGSLTKSDYKVGETYSAAGLSVLGHYDNESTKPLDVAITFNKTVAALGDTAIIASVEYEDLSDEKEFTVTVTKVDENVIDVSSVDSYSITSDGEGLPSSYGEGSNTNFAWTGLYKGQNDSIQGNSSKSSELHNVRAFSKEITYIKFNVGYAAGDAATGEVRFGSSAQPTGNAGKYGANTDYSLTELGSFVIFAPSSSTYLSVVWTKGASYFSSIDVHFDEYKEGGSAVDSVSLNKDSITLEAGSSETLVPTIAPSDAANKQVTWSSSDEDIATVDTSGKVTAVAEGTAIITVTTKDGGKTDTCSVTVTKASEGGSTAIDLGGDVSVVFGGVTYEKSLKAGSGKVAGSTTINVPSGAKKLIFYAAGWNGETVKISVTGGGISQTLSLTSDSGVSGSSPFTIGSTTESNFKFEIDVSSLTGATTLTLTATSGNRFVVWNASYTK